MIKTEYYKDLTKMNTFGMKVKTRCFIEYDSVADLVDIEFEELARPVLHIGGGSNLLFIDDFKGTVLHSKINFIEILDDHQQVNESPIRHCEEQVNGSPIRHCEEHVNESPIRHCEEPVNGSPIRHCEEQVNESPIRHCEEQGDVAISSPVLVSVGAGVVFDDFCDWAAKEGLWGVENLSYIPGEVGASAVQNIGAYGVEVKDVIKTVYCYDTVEEEFVNFDVEDLEYGYRDSAFKDPEVKGRYIVTHVVFALSRNPQPKLDYGHLKEAVLSASASLSSDPRLSSDRHPLAVGGMSLSSDTDAEQEILARVTPAMIRKAIIKIRKEKLPEPSVMGSAGSFFKNPVISAEHFAKIEATAKAELGADYKVPHYVVEEPVRNCEEQSDVVICHMVKVPAAWLIEQCGWKGKRSGNAAVYDKQPLVIVNYTGEAFPEEIISLERRIIASVKAKFDIILHPEVEHI